MNKSLFLVDVNTNFESNILIKEKEKLNSFLAYSQVKLYSRIHGVSGLCFLDSKSIREDPLNKIYIPVNIRLTFRSKASNKVITFTDYNREVIKFLFECKPYKDIRHHNYYLLDDFLIMSVYSFIEFIYRDSKDIIKDVMQCTHISFDGLIFHNHSLNVIMTCVFEDKDIFCLNSIGDISDIQVIKDKEMDDLDRIALPNLVITGGDST